MKGVAISILMLVLISCEKITKIELPEREPLMSMDALAFIGDSLIIFPGISASLTQGQLPQSRDDFDIRLFEDGVLIDTLEPRPYQNFSSVVYRYHSVATLVPGREYRLEGRADQLPLASSVQVAPFPVDILNFASDSADNRLNLKIADPAGISNFYLIEVYNSNLEPNMGLESIRSTDPEVELLYEDIDIFNGGFGGRRALLADENFDGQIRDIEIFYGPGLYAGQKYSLRISAITRAFYLHEKSRSVQFMNEQQVFSEGTNLYSNVNNGYGAFIIANPEILEFDP